MSIHDHPDHEPHDRTAGEISDRGVPSTRSDAALRRIGEALHGLKYGSVLAVVQDGFVVQIERTEKTRFNR
jgi:hypothetical protein